MASIVALAGVLGALIGSFLNVVIHRVPLGESVVAPRSRCPGCHTELALRDNVPVISWLMLRGRCRTCARSISVRYPMVEALTAGLFAITTVVVGVDTDLAWALPFVAVLVCLGAIDLDHRIVPNKILLPTAIYGVAVAVAMRWSELPELAVGAIGAFVFLLTVALIRPDGMGMGDVKLAGVMGLYLGAAVIPALLLAFVAGSVVGVAIMVRGGVELRKSGVPFAPFLAVGATVAVWSGDWLLEAYVNRFL